MTIEIRGKEYNFEMFGTIGTLYMAEKLLDKGETLDLNNPQHLSYVFYSILAGSNKDYPDLQTFILSLTGEKVKKMSDYFSEQWTKLEPPVKEEAKEDAPKND